MSTMEQNKAAVRRFLHLVASGNTSEMEQFIDPRWISHNPPLPPLQGLDGACMLAGLLNSAFPDARVAIDDIIGEGDRVAVRCSFSGTNRGTLLGVPPTGRGVSVVAMAVFTVQDGKLVNDWIVFDGLGMLQQLGATPMAWKPAA